MTPEIRNRISATEDTKVIEHTTCWRLVGMSEREDSGRDLFSEYEVGMEHRGS